MRFLLIASAALFLLLSILVATGATRGFDNDGESLVQLIHDPWLDAFGSAMTVAGQTEVTVVVTGVWAVWRLQRRRPLWYMPLVIVIGIAIEAVFKLTIPQPLPPQTNRAIEIIPFVHASLPYAFPSGHVMRMTFLCTVASGSVQIASRGTAVVLSVAVIALMALTRVYLGEHWPSDVVGGALLGLALGIVALRSPSGRSIHQTSSR